MSISQRKDGRYLVKLRDDQGKWKQRSFRDQDEAIAFDAEANATIEDTRLSMGELIVLYLRSNPDLYHETRRRIMWLYADGGPAAFLRDKIAETFTRQDLEHLRENLRARKVTNNTINHYHAYSSMILAWGADQELISRHPWRDFKKLKVQRPMMRTTLADLKYLYPFLPEWLQWAAKTAFFLAVRPGLRELFSLEWGQFDFRRGSVTIRQGKTGLLKTVYPSPAYLSEAALRYALDQKRGYRLVCHHENGTPVRSYDKAWHAACKQAGVKMRFYDLRHLAASEMLARGADLAAVAAQLGHTNTNTTGRTYTHVLQGGQQHAAAIMPSLE